MNNFLTKFAACGAGAGGGLDLGFPTWYKYLNCPNGDPEISNINDVWNIGWGLIEMLLFIASVAAVFFLILGGIQFITSQGAPDKTAQARQTITYAIVGLVVSIIARALVQFIGGQFGANVV